MLVQLLRQRVLRFMRSSAITQNVAALGLAALFAYIPIFLLVVFAAAGLPFVLREQGVAVVPAMSAAWPVLLLALAPLTAYLTRDVSAPLPVLLRQPVSRRRIAAVLTGVSGINKINAGLLLVLLCAWTTGPLIAGSPVQALAWLATALLLFVAGHLLTQTFRALLHTSGPAFILAGLLLYGGLFADLNGPGATTAFGAWVFAADGAHEPIVLAALLRTGSLIAAIAALFAGTVHVTARHLYLDQRSGSRTGHASRGPLSALPPVLRTDLRILLRHTRTRWLLVSTISMAVLGASNIVRGIQEDKLLIAISGLVIVPMIGHSFLLSYMHRMRAAFMDGLASRPIPFQRYTRSALRIADAALVAGAVVTLPVVIWNALEIGIFLAGCFFYGLGVNNFTGTFMAAWIREPFAPDASMFSMQGTPGGDQFGPVILMNLLSCAPLIAVAILSPSLTGPIPMAVTFGLGTLGLLLRSALLPRAVAFHQGRRHTLLNAYREGQ